MKNPLFSKTLQGILLLVLPALLARCGVKLDDAAAQGLVEDVCLGLGAVWSIYGRFTAELPLKNPLKGTALPLVLAFSLLTGCASLSDGQRDALLSGAKLAAKVALQLGLGELSQRVNELQPYTQRLGLLIETTFSEARSQKSEVSPEAIAGGLKAHVAAVIPAAHQAAVLDALVDALARTATTASELRVGELRVESPDGRSVAAAAREQQHDFNLALALALKR